MDKGKPSTLADAEKQYEREQAVEKRELEEIQAKIARLKSQAEHMGRFVTNKAK